MKEPLQIIDEIIQQKLKPVYARIERIEAELQRHHRLISELEQRIDELEGAEVDDHDIINNVEDADFDQSILEHLITDPLIQPDAQKNTTHVSLTIDLSKKNLS